MTGHNATAVPDRARKRSNSTAWLLLSILFAPGLWAVDATSMSLFWLANPFGRSREKITAATPVSPLKIELATLDASVRPARIRQWKLAFSLAVVAAIAAPFVSRSYKEHPTYAVWEPLTAQEKNELVSLPSKLPAQTTYADPLSDCLISESSGNYICNSQLESGGSYSYRSDLTKYLRINTLVSLLAFATTFLTLLMLFGAARALGGLGRRYWSWLHA